MSFQLVRGAVNLVRGRMNNVKYFLLLTIVCAGSLRAQTNNIGQTIPASAFGFTVSDITHEITPILPFSIGRSWDAFHVSWAYLNPCAKSYDWTNFDHFTATNAGKDMVYTFGVVPDWAASAPNSNTPYPQAPGYFKCADGTKNLGGTSCSMPGKSVGDTTAWDAFVTAIATHSAAKPADQQVRYWELWNEPMNYQYWCAGGSGPFNTKAAAFAQTALMFQHASSIIKSIIPGAVIFAPSTDKDFGIAWLNKYIDNGGKVVWDQMAVHGYPNNSTGAHAPETMPAMVAQYGAWNAAHGGAIPIIDTEAAWGDAASDGGIWLTKLFLLSWSSGVSRTIWYGYDNVGLPLWDRTAGVTAQGTAFANVQNWMVGATMTSPCSKDGAGTYTCPLTRPGGYSAVVTWNTAPAAMSETPATGMTDFRDIKGATYAVSGSVSVGTSPILLEAPVRKLHRSSPTAQHPM